MNSYNSIPIETKNFITKSIFFNYQQKIKTNNKDILFCTEQINYLYDESLELYKSNEIVQLIRARKILFITENNSKYTKDIENDYIFNVEKSAEYQQQAIISIESLLPVTKKSHSNNMKYTFIRELHTLFNCIIPQHIFEDLQIFKLLHSELKNFTTNTDEGTLIKFFDKITKSVCYEVSLAFIMFSKTIRLFINSTPVENINLLNTLSLSICWIVTLITKIKIPLQEIHCSLDSIILLSMQQLGYDPWLMLDLTNTDLYKFCRVNRLLTKCFDIYYYAISCIDLHTVLVEKSFVPLKNYAYFLLAKIIPLIFSNANFNIKNQTEHIEVLPQVLLLATYKVVPGVIASAVMEEQPFNSNNFLFNQDKFFIGEEFEFCNLTNNYEFISKEKKALLAWKTYAENYMATLKIQDYNFLFQELTMKVSASIGDWSYKLFRDEEQLEINTTPYRVQDIFTVNQDGVSVKYNSYQMFDLFIHPIIHFFGYSGVSGHKHFDARSLNGNTELLLRIVIDYENNSWLPAAIGRASRAKDYFPYLTNDYYNFKTELIKDLVVIINEKLNNPEVTSKYGSFEDLVHLATVFNYLKIFDKHSPCALHHITLLNNTPNINIEPTTTVELRMFNFPQDGEESHLITTLILHRIQYLLDCQKNRQPIKYNPIDPESYKNRKKILVAFNSYVEECGLDASKYQKILRI